MTSKEAHPKAAGPLRLGLAGKGKEAGPVTSLCFVSLWAPCQRQRSLGGSELCGTSLNHKKEDHVGFGRWPLNRDGHGPWSKEGLLGKEWGSDVLGAGGQVERKHLEQVMLGL